MAKQYCDDCGVTHTSVMCFSKPRRRIKSEAPKTYHKRQKTSYDWFDANPPDKRGVWYCYLNISPACEIKLTRSTIQLEHVKSKARAPHLKYDINNLKPACKYCNKLKGSRDAEEVMILYSGNKKGLK